MFYTWFNKYLTKTNNNLIKSIKKSYLYNTSYNKYKIKGITLLNN